MKHWLNESAGCLIPILTLAITIALICVITRAIVNSDLPLWIKFILLK